VKAESPAGPENGRIRALDGIRGLAILMVLAWHLFFSTWHPEAGSFGAYVSRFASLLWMGVDLFFVLSGFLVTRVLMDLRGMPGCYVRFYGGRFFRIVPAYALLLLLYLLLRQSSLAETAAGLWMFENCPPLWSFCCFWQNQAMVAQSSHGGQFLAPTWSLAVEEQFYLLLPLVIFWLPSRALSAMVGLLWLAGWLSKWCLHLSDAHPTAVWLPLVCRLDALMTGAICAIWLHRQRESFGKAWLIRNHRRLVWTVMLAFAAFAALLPRIGWNVLVCCGATALAAGFGLMVASAAIVSESESCSWLKSKPLAWLGTISYGVYLFHQPINGLMHAITTGGVPSMGTWLSFLITVSALGVTLILCTILWWQFERPLIQYGRRGLGRKTGCD
jgi:peptidoglycan/LPS O-acetylase OafA/YrhL